VRLPALYHLLRHVEHAYPLLDGVRALMPPQGLLVVAAALPAS
jgi:hypothetical protein